MPRFPLASGIFAAVAGASFAVFATGCTGSVMSSSEEDDGKPSNGSAGASGGKSGSGGGSGGSFVGDRPTPPASAGLGRLTDKEAMACGSGPQDPGAGLMRRLNHREYNNTIADLLFDTSQPAKTFATDERLLNFDNNAARLTVSPALAESYNNSSATLATNAVANNYAKLVTCDPAKDNACSRKFIQDFGQRAFRRPLATDEVARLEKVFAQGLTTDFKNGVKLVIQTVLQSAPFLYRIEFGEQPVNGAQYVKLNSWEMASRLSYFLWSSMPDAELFAAAAANKLGDRAAVQAQVTRMLNNDKAHRVVESFHEQWLGMGDAVSADKDAKLHPAWTPDMLSLLKEETARFVDDVFWSGGDFKTLLRAPYSVVNAKVATLYGLTGSAMPTGTAWKKVDLDPSQRSGILTQGSTLAHFAKSNATSPVLRGKFVREQFFGDLLQPPPGDIPPAPEVDPNLTTRQRFAQHSTDAKCAGCHAMMDPLGFGLEAFDATGKFRTQENGQTVDVSGKVNGTDVPGEYSGAVGLATKLADSQQVKRSYVTNWFRFAYNRQDEDKASDACLLHALDARFSEGKFNLKNLVTALTDTEAFYLRRAGGAQ